MYKLTTSASLNTNLHQEEIKPSVHLVSYDFVNITLQRYNLNQMSCNVLRYRRKPSAAGVGLGT